ncbi:MAG: tRNA (adenosine(37)-N6)-threonylcarbamoyltransferase complex ATPase subunit type 1 TsaE [Saprospiraceae bacterium]|nr:tRNA (adenosine(37)-N6)-threonylcarbamoyltransferase complex ATPase subunit type 1 TsaE [Saprospiraceae bacterium]MCB9355081.1 tRNA (adenosine(37)-N6)-threonylcarbamoyltransferase complex ATPase subunit type 1 TsaE [Lewinellaceae bacterium]
MSGSSYFCACPGIIRGIIQIKRYRLELPVNSLAELETCIPAVLDALDGRRKIALYGEMGAGKTSFVAAFCRYLGVRDTTASPTFSLINQYRYVLSDGSTALFHHLDLYRLNTPQEALDIGIEDLLYDPWYCVIEWPQLAESLLPDGFAKIQIEITGETSRRIIIL